MRCSGQFILLSAFQELRMKLLVVAMMLCMAAAAQTNSKSKTGKGNSKPGGGSQKFLPLAGQFMRESLALSPVNASQAGYHRHTDPVTKKTIALGAQEAADWQLIRDQISLNLLDLDQIHSYQHNPTVYVELIGNALFLPLTQNYASKEVRLGHVLARMQQIPRLLDQAKAALLDADPIYVKVAVEENDGNI